MDPHFVNIISCIHTLSTSSHGSTRLTCMQLVAWDPITGKLGSEPCMLFGKRDHDEYALDYGAPLTAVQAFAIGEGLPHGFASP